MRGVLLGVVLVVAIAACAGNGSDPEGWTVEPRDESVDVPQPPREASGNGREYGRYVLTVAERLAVYGERVRWREAEARLATLSPSSPRQAYPVISAVLAQLDDGHSRLLPAGPPATDRDRLASFERPTSTKSRDIATVVLPTLAGAGPSAGTTYANAARRAITELIGTEVRCGWIVDLRRNHGGDVYPMLAGVAGFLPSGRAFGFQSRDGQIDWVIVSDGEISFRGGTYRVNENARRLEKAPVALLLGPETASAAEFVALSFLTRDNTRLFGSTTAGVITSPDAIPMPDGATLMIATHAGVDRHGSRYDDGIVPDEQAQPDQPDASVAAKEWLTDRCRST